jgi:hypothetical protein
MPILRESAGGYLEKIEPCLTPLCHIIVKIASGGRLIMSKFLKTGQFESASRICKSEETQETMKGMHKTFCFIAVLVLCAAIATTAWAQGRGPRANSHIQMISQALTKASAPALDSTQESALQAAAASLRNTRRPAPDAAEKNARDSYAAAILAGDGASAQTAADQLADIMAQRQKRRLEAEAAFAIQVFSILHSDQIAALQSSMGKEGLLRLVTSPAGPAGSGFGRGMMGRGPMPPRPMGNR